MIMSLHCIIILLCFLPVLSFQHIPDKLPSHSQLQGLTGRGWDNENFLDSLGGSDEDIDRANKEYKSYANRRQAFQERQAQYAQTEAGKKAMQYLQGREQQSPEHDDGDISREPASRHGGGPRIAAMMQQAQRQEEQSNTSSQGMMIGGFEQKLAVPLDDDDETPTTNQNEGLLF